MIEVFHMKDDMPRDMRASLALPYQAGDAKAALEAGHYEKVATVDTDLLEVAWRLTNNVETSWSMEPDPRVTLTAPLPVIDGKTYGRKSSELGDVFVQNGSAYVVAAVGFHRLPTDG